MAQPAPATLPKRKFQVRLEFMGPGGSWTCIRLPFSVEEVFGTKARLAVKGTINDFAFRSSVFPDGSGAHIMMINKAMQKGSGSKAGDIARVVMERDDTPRTLSVPKDLGNAIANERETEERWEAFSYSWKKEYLDWIEAAKREETRARRIEKAVTLVSAGKRLK